jgi:hypothetical protein
MIGFSNPARVSNQNWLNVIQPRLCWYPSYKVINKWMLSHRFTGQSSQNGDLPTRFLQVSASTFDLPWASATLAVR